MYINSKPYSLLYLNYTMFVYFIYNKTYIVVYSSKTIDSKALSYENSKRDS